MKNLQWVNRRTSHRCLVSLDRASQLFCLLICLTVSLPHGALGQPSQASAPRALAVLSNNYTVTSRGPHSRTWQRIGASTNRLGQVTLRTNSVVELATGLDHLIGTNWTPSSEAIDITPFGGIATNGQHQVGFAANLNVSNAVEILTPDGKDLKTHVLGLSYFDSASGSNILIAETKDTLGLLVSSNCVIYPDAFTDLKADVRYTYSKAGVEQDIILREQPPAPSTFGLSPQTTRLQVWTEFFNPPAPQITASPTNDDVNLRFGGMTTGRGKAFFIGDSSNAIPVRKAWVTAQGRTFLVEQVSFYSIAARVQSLPAPGTASLNLPASKPRLRQLPDQLPDAPLLAQRGAGVSPAPLKSLAVSRAPAAYPTSLGSAGAPSDPSVPSLGSAGVPPAPSGVPPDGPSAPGLVMDYYLVDWWIYGNLITYQDFDFAADTTYLITGPTYITGTTTLEPGAIIKFTDGSSPDDPVAGLNVEYLVCPTGAQPMAVLTSVDDNSVGEPIGSGSPVTGTYNFYLRAGGNPNNIQDIAVSNLKVSYAANGVQSGSVVDSEFYHCARAVTTTQNENNWVVNDLFSACDVPVSGGGGVEVEQVTCDSPHFTDGTIYANILNSLFTGDFNGVEYLSSYDPATLNLSPGIFQSANGDHYYLANNSPYRNTGSTAIDGSTAQDIAQRTTYPPPQTDAEINSGTPDLGYHYVPVQYNVLFNAWLASYFGSDYQDNPNAAATADPDGDGVDNWHEYLAGTIPVARAHLVGISNGAVLSGMVSLQVEVDNTNTSSPLVSLYLKSLDTNFNGTIPGTSFLDPTNGLGGIWDTAQVTNGTYTIQLGATLGNTSTIQDTPLTVTVANAAWFPDPVNIAGDSIYCGVQTVFNSGTFGLDVYDDQSNIVQHVDGVIGSDGYLNLPGNSGPGFSLPNTDAFGNQNSSQYYDLAYTVNGEGSSITPPSGPPWHITQRQFTERQWDLPTTGAVICYWEVFPNSAPDAQNEEKTTVEVMAQTDTVWSGGFDYYRPPVAGIGTIDNPYEVFSSTGGWTAVLNGLKQFSTRDFVYFGHGSDTTLGGGTIYSETVARALQNNQPNSANMHPFRFVFLDACQTANGDWPLAFGIPKQEKMTTSDFVDKRGIRPRAFMGWNTDKLAGWPNQGVMNPHHKEYTSSFWNFWLNGTHSDGGPATLADAIRVAGVEKDPATQQSYTNPEAKGMVVYGTAELTIWW